MDDFYRSIAAEVFVSDFSVIDRKNNRVLYTSLSEQSLIGWLCNYLYLKYYARDKNGLKRLFEHEPRYGTVVDLEDPDVAKAAVSGCSHDKCLDRSWKRIGDGCRVTNGALILECDPESFVKIDGNEYVVRSAIQRFLLPGWLYITGVHGFDSSELTEVFRYYHSVSGAACLEEAFRLLTSALNIEGFEYRVKVANNKSGLGRNDALVLYSKHPLPVKIMKEIGLSFGSDNRVWESCPFVSSISGGWGYAKELFGSVDSFRTSYGQKCCFLLARGLVLADSSVESCIFSMKKSFIDGRLDFHGSCT